MIYRLCLGQALLVALVHCAAVTNVKKDPETGEARIVNGSACPIKDHPYMVDIRYSENLRHHCGGSLISKFFVLTAAHCCKKNYRVGEYSAYVGGTVGLRAAKHIIIKNHIHEDEQIHDVCLMELGYPIHQAPGIRYVQLASRIFTEHERLTDVCKYAVAIGYGDQYVKDFHGEPYPSTPIPPHDTRLQCAELPVIDLDVCADQNGDPSYPSNVLCAYSPGKDTCQVRPSSRDETHFALCQGDSGGPLTCNKIQYGVVHGGYGCAFKQYAGLYMRVDYYEPWIEGILGAGSRQSAAAMYQGHFCVMMLLGLVYLDHAV